MNAPALEFPHSLEAERSVLGAVLLRNDAWTDVRDAVGPEDFYRQGHRLMFRHMETLAQAGRAIDLVTLVDILERHGEIDEAGGASYVSRLIDDIPRSTNATHYAEVVREYARRRHAIEIARQLLADAVTADDVNEAIAAAEKALREVESGRALELTGMEAAVTAGLDELEGAAQSEWGITGVATGMFTLDRMLGGLQPGDLIVLAARPSVGKSAAAGQWAIHAALQGVPVLFVTLEMRASKLALRMASNLAMVDLVAVKNKSVTEEEMRRLSHRLEQIHRAPITFLDHREVRMSDIRRHARRLHAQGKCSLLVIDYLQIVTPERSSTRGENRQEQVAQQSKLGKSIARELDIPVVVLSQIDRAVEKDGGTKKYPGQRPPRLADLRESGAIEQDADDVIFVHRPFVRPETLEERAQEGQTELIVAKQRNGPIGKVRARYIPAFVRFDETEGE